MKEHNMVLPELSDDVVEKVEEVLRELGVESEKELRFVEEKDLTADGVLSKIKARKLITAWAEGETGTTAMGVLFSAGRHPSAPSLPPRKVWHLTQISVFQEDEIVNDVLAVADFPTTLFVIVLGNIIEPKEIIVTIEKEPVANFKTVLEAIVYCFCSYYVFNMTYCPEITALLEFVQRYYAKIGAKSRKRRRHSVHPKVVRLSKLLKKSEDAED